MTQQRQDTPIVVYVLGALVMAGLVAFVGVLCLPITVDAVAYLAGDGGQGTFTATSSSTNCTWDGSQTTCSTTTYGYLDPGHSPATWTGQVHGTFPVRRPVWVWIGGASLFNRGTAIYEAILFGSTQLALAAALPFVARRGYRARRSANKGRTRDTPAAA
jgi:hypothetical protein